MLQGFVKQSTAVNITILAIDSSDHITGKTGLSAGFTIYATKAAGSPATITPTVTELDATNVKGVYKLALTSGHTDTLGELQLHITGSGMDPLDIKFQVATYLPGEAATLQADQAVNTTKVGGTAQTGRDLGASVLLSTGTGTGQLDFTAGVVKSNSTQWLGGTIPAVNVTGVPKVDLIDWLGSAPSALISGRVDSNAQAMAANVITSSIIAANAIGASQIATDAITAAKIADSAIDRATFAADTGLATSRSNTAAAGAGGTITLDASASAVDSFYNDSIIYLTGGTGVGQSRLIVGYVGATKVATIAPNWATNPDNTSTFGIIPRGRVDVGYLLGSIALAYPTNYSSLVIDSNGRVDLSKVLGSAINALISGKVDANAQTVGDKTGYALGVGGIAASAFAANAIDSAALATSAAQEIRDTILSDATAFAGADIATIKTKTNLIPATPASQADVTGLLTTTVADSISVVQTLRLVLAVLGGKLSGAATTTVTIRSAGDTKDVVVATVDSNGNRSAVTLDLT